MAINSTPALHTFPYKYVLHPTVCDELIELPDQHLANANAFSIYFRPMNVLAYGNCLIRSAIFAVYK